MSISSEIVRIRNEIGGQTTLIEQIQAALAGKSGGGGAAVIEPLSVTANGNYTAPSGVDGYSPVTVNVPTGTARSSSDLTVSGRTVMVPAGLYREAASKSIANGEAGTPTASKGVVSNHSITVTPSVQNTTGYITGGTKTGVGVSVSASELVSGGETKTENGTYDVTNLEQLTVNVPQTSGKSIQISTGVSKITNKTSYTATNATITVAKTGNYRCRWFHYASASGSSYYLTQLYIGSTAVGSTHACPAYNGSSGWVAEESNISLTAGQTVTVRARTRSGSSYWTVAGLLVIEEL